MAPVDAGSKAQVSRSDHAAQLRKSGIEDPQYVLPDFPRKLGYIWNWYCDLTAYGLTPPNILAYFQLIGIKPKRFEVELLMRLDRET
jgi:hypothetical protein